jgi:hypothetical protein
MDQVKVQAIKKWKPSNNVHELQIFLNFANYYRRFIRNYSKVTLPLTNLLRKENKTKFPLSEQALSAFQQLKTAFSSAPIFAHSNPLKPSILKTDASDGAIAGVLLQSDEDNMLHPVVF